VSRSSSRVAAARSVRLVRLPAHAAPDPITAAEAFLDRPGIALLESARPGRRARWTYLVADPLAWIEEPAGGADPFAGARGHLWRMSPDAVVAGAASPAWHGAAIPGSQAGGPPPPFIGGLLGYVSYDLGCLLESLRFRVPDDQGLPLLRLGLYDWAIAWDGRTGAAWAGGRAIDGDAGRLETRLADVLDTLTSVSVRVASDRGPGDGAQQDVPARAIRFESNMDGAGHARRIDAIRDAISRGDIYQANLVRRLAAPFDVDPWPLYRQLRHRDPAPFAAYVDLGTSSTGAPRALVSASPEPFLAIDPDGRVATDPVKGTRPRGDTVAADRAMAQELLASAKDRAENVMIVDVLRNDIGRVCVPGSVRVPRLCRLERTSAVQHLVSTVTGNLAAGHDALDLLRVASPGGSITGAPKIRAMQILEALEPVRRGPYSGSLGWIGPDGAMATSLLIRTFVADGRQLTFHVGGGITARSEAGAEWEETVSKAAGPLRAIGGIDVEAEAVGAAPNHVHASPAAS
jgi:para-aminobenzoate synthetase component 1